MAGSKLGTQVLWAVVLAAALKFFIFTAFGSAFLLAGILARQADELTEAYAPWVKLSVADEEEGWILMTAQRA